MANRFKGLDMEHIELAIKHLAQFHAISYAMCGGDAGKVKGRWPFAEEKMFQKAEKVNKETRTFFDTNQKMQAEMLEGEGLEWEARCLRSFGGDRFYDKMNWATDGETRWAVLNHGGNITHNHKFHKPSLIYFTSPHHHAS